jgi:GrpB-like predicted nucleotidyltransferase (UPF0157 family)
VDKRTIEVLDYNDNWPAMFEREKRELLSVIGDLAISIEHIGSTSVPGLAAKPIIDILIEVGCVNELDPKAAAFTRLGYEVKGENGIKGRRYYQKGGNQRSHHIHAFQSNSLDLFRHRAFKQYLIKHPALAEEYAAIKQTAARYCDHDNERYISLKNHFILEHEKRAIEWYSNETTHA